MLERLIEGWLDSSSERSYQAPFCQMLLAQGYTVVHSTRHAPIEFGKDVIAIAPDGTPCAFQLKGNPGGRLTHAKFREIQPQLIELATQAIVFPGIPRKPHRSFLVTNGQVDEEVQRAIDDMNRNFEQQRLSARIELITRGQLLAWAKELEESLWPTEIEDINYFLQLLAHDGRSLFPVERLHHLLLRCLRLSEDSEQPSAAEVVRRLYSAGLLTGICLRSFHKELNHYAVIAAWVTFAAYAIAVCDRYGLPFGKTAEESVGIAEDEIFRSLLLLWQEIEEKPHLVEGNPPADFITYRWRYTLLVALVSVLWFWFEEQNPTGTDAVRSRIKNFLSKKHDFLELWGEASIPQFMAYLWFKRATDATVAPDVDLAGLLKALQSRNHPKSKLALASSYYGFEEIARHATGLVTFAKESSLDKEAFAGSSFFAVGFMHLLVRTNLKQTCKELWPDFTRLHHRRFEPDESWRFCLWRVDKGKGKEVARDYPATMEWTALVEEARDVECRGVPKELKNRKFLLLLFTILFPYRATPEVIRYLGWKFNKSWLISSPRESS